MDTPFGCKVQCSKCDSEESMMWHPAEEGVQCSKCLENAHLALQVLEKEEQKPPVSSEKSKSPSKKSIKSTRSYKTRQNPNAVPKQITPKGKSRRQIFKKTVPVKLQTAHSTYTTVESVFHENVAFRVGDIVAYDTEERVYYAQISGLIVDQYGEKSATIKWLVPNRVITDRNEFNPLDYTVFLDDEMPHILDSLSFVMHSPMEYYRNNIPQSSSQICSNIRNVMWGRLSHLF